MMNTKEKEREVCIYDENDELFEENNSSMVASHIISALESNQNPFEIQSLVAKLTKKDIVAMLEKHMPTNREVRYLVDLYYSLQKYRISTSNQERAANKNNEKSESISFFKNEFFGIEKQIKNLLDVYTSFDPVGNTLKQIRGVGPVIAAGLISNLDIKCAKHAGSYWRFCGIDPTVPGPTKGEKLHYNKKLKTLVAFKLGESFVKVQNRPDDIYGKHYKIWKEEYKRRNENGEYAETARNILASKNFKKDTEARKAYESGKLPDGHIHAMARRKPCMYFISHLFDLQYMLEYNKAPDAPWVIMYGGENHTKIMENPLITTYEDLYGPILK